LPAKNHATAKIPKTGSLQLVSTPRIKNRSHTLEKTQGKPRLHPLGKPVESFGVALALEVVTEIWVGVRRQRCDERVKAGGGRFESGEMGGRIAVAERVIGHEIEAILDGSMEVGVAHTIDSCSGSTLSLWSSPVFPKDSAILRLSWLPSSPLSVNFTLTSLLTPCSSIVTP